MTKPGYFPSTGKKSFTKPAHKISFCREIFCCSDVPDEWDALFQFEMGSSQGNVVLHCEKIIMTKINATTWTGTIAVVPNCLQGKNGEEINIEFTCNDQGPIDPRDCKQVFSWSMEGESITVVNCCCFDSDPQLTGVDAGNFCISGGLSPLWTGARLGDGTGCGCNDWDDDTEAGSLSIAWGWDPDLYGDPCCEPAPCPDDCCPPNPCAGQAQMAPPTFDEIPEDLGWLRDISELARNSTDGG